MTLIDAIHGTLRESVFLDIAPANRMSLAVEISEAIRRVVVAELGRIAHSAPRTDHQFAEGWEASLNEAANRIEGGGL